ncbi:MAG: alpha-1,2-fucosyltransferase [Bacillus sp. (in: Bacteria)]|nr:alpha-1,2-fucosyltransferase [Bacillus sp. (in: firmicutes)]MCM1425513.1 alpha-1,2-fucosyltransferase [Eubacterium sp.]
MIVVKIKGGLGNQMFEYAMARKIQVELGIKQLGLDTTNIQMDPLRKLGLHHFRLCEEVIFLDSASESIVLKLQKDFARRLISYFVAGRPEKIARRREEKLEKLFHLFGIVHKDYSSGISKDFCLKMHRNIYMNGWFQEAKAIESIRGILLKDFTYTGKISDKMKDMENRIEKTNSVCVHIRRTDYVNHPRFGICTEQYYYTAMEKAAAQLKKPVFYIFSDDIEEVKKWNFGYDIIFDEVCENELESLYLMSKCKHFVISNSTFSWWGQFLAQNEDKLVIAPNRWCRDYNETALYMDGWTLVEV